ncbi:hypothetical protein ACG2LH_11040 [Zhouia sp. PK063]|uniref:hypothetical protein n=1 Tax=Zhouia sp. PK063 TaxID=3373602 RepID=UPI0037B866CC
MAISKKRATQLLKDPEAAAKFANLIYVYETDLCIERLVNGEKFSYCFKNDIIKDETVIKRIHSLVIPPAWQHVKIAKQHNAHLQVIGFDAKKKKTISISRIVECL